MSSSACCPSLYSLSLTLLAFSPPGSWLQLQHLSVAMMNAKVVFALATFFGLGVTLLILVRSAPGLCFAPPR